MGCPELGSTAVVYEEVVDLGWWRRGRDLPPDEVVG